jgi:regulator of sigma E protease
VSTLIFGLNMAWKILFIVFFFGFCIFIHEFGHLLAGLWRGLHVDKFSIGFGKKIWGTTIRGVEYVVSWLPFGGYVMLPQLEPSAEPETLKGEKLPPCSPVDRIVAALAGPLFNLLFGFLLAGIMWAVGVWEPAPAQSCLITKVPQILPLYKDGLKMTDLVLAVNGQEVANPDTWEVVSENLPADSGTLLLKVKQKEQEVELSYEPVVNPEWTAGLRPGFRIIAVNDRPFTKGVEEVNMEYVYKKGQNVTLRVIDNDGQQRDITYPPAPNPMMEDLGVPFFTASNPVVVGAVLPDSAAARKGLQAGDQLLAVNDRNVATAADFTRSLVELSGSSLSLTVNRKGQEKVLTDLQLPPDELPTAAALGLAFNVMVKRAAPDSPAARAGLQHGDRLVSVNGQDIIDVRMFIDTIKNSAGEELTLLLYRSGTLLTVALRPEKVPVEEGGVYRIGLELAGSDPKVIGHPNPWQQFSNVFIQTYRTLGLLFSPLGNRLKSLTSGQEAESSETQIQVKHLSGPLGILLMLWYKLKFEGLRGGLSFIILISFSLAIFNLLPLPVLDGGHIAYAILELIIRRRLPVKLVTILQNVFAALLIGLMLYITVFDGKRIFVRLHYWLSSTPTPVVEKNSGGSELPQESVSELSPAAEK